MAGSFEDYGLLPELCNAVYSIGWALPTDIQSECIPLILGGGDVMAAAETGSGKTGAFCLPLLQIVHETRRDIALGKGESDPKSCAMSSSDRGVGFAVSADGMVCQARDANSWHGGRATVGVHGGKYFYEATVTDEGLCRVGWSTRNARLDLGTDNGGFGFGGTGKKSTNKKFEDYGESFGLRDVIGCYLDCDCGEVSFTKNGKDLGKAFEIPKFLKGHLLYPACVLKNAEMSFNFGGKPFAFEPKKGFMGVAQAAAKDTSCAPQQPGSDKKKLMALIIEPSLELAQQTHEEILKFSKFLPEPRLRAELFIGGVSSQPQMDAIRKGLDVVTATPGRLLDLVQSKNLDLSDVRFLVLDEADRLLDSGNFKCIEQVYDSLDKTHLQVLMFSATLHSPEIAKLSQKICKFPTWVDLKGRDSVPLSVQHAQVLIDPCDEEVVKTFKWSQKLDIQLDGVHSGDAQARVKNSREWKSERTKILKARYLLEIINAHKIEQAIIFIRTRLDAEHLENFLNRMSELEGGKSAKLEKKYSCLQLHAGKGTDARKDNLEAFKNGEVRFLIATDVAARGIDIKELPFVINYTLPDRTEDYIHRVGRVGRAGHPGLAISLVASCEEKVWFHTCKNKGQGCRNTKLVAKGGCCVWYDEPKLMKAVIERLGEEPVPFLESGTFAFPGGLNVLHSADQEKKKLAEHFDQIAAMVGDLRELEKKLQIGFFDLQNMKK